MQDGSSQMLVVDLLRLKMKHYGRGGENEME